MYTVNDLLQMAISEIHALEDGEKFTLKDLYKGYVWNRITRGDRIALGTLFLNFAKTENEIKLLGKSNSGQQSYQKIIL